MQSRSSQPNTLNDDLNDLKKVFDLIEGYDLHKNISLPSLKSLGVWLCVYALTDKADQERVIDELIKKSLLKDFSERIRSWINKLSTPATLVQIIEDYEASGGIFKIFVPDLNMKNSLKVKIHLVGLSHLLDERVEIKSEEENISIDLINNIKFVWACDTTSTCNTNGEKIYAATQFNDIGEKPFGLGKQLLPFVSANNQNHNIGYNLVTFSGCHYHVVTFKTKQLDLSSQERNTETYLIEPVSDRARDILQLHYFDILHYAHKEEINYSALIQNLQRIQGISHLQVTEMQTEKMSEQQYDYNVNVNFPILSQPFKTVETRLGIWASFKNITFAASQVHKISYTSLRGFHSEAVEDNNQIVEAFMSVPISAPHNKYKLIEVTINYTASNPFMLVHQGIAKSDYHPFWIHHPSKGLEEKFAEPQVYKALIATNSPALFSRPAVPGSTLSLALDRSEKKSAATESSGNCCACNLM